MPVHRMLTVPVCEIHKGDTVLVYKDDHRNWASFHLSITTLADMDRCAVTEIHRDPADGTYYIAVENETGQLRTMFLEPHIQIKLDCLLTFGKNGPDR